MLDSRQRRSVIQKAIPKNLNPNLVLTAEDPRCHRSPTPAQVTTALPAPSHQYRHAVPANDTVSRGRESGSNSTAKGHGADPRMALSVVVSRNTNIELRLHDGRASWCANDTTGCTKDEGGEGKIYSKDGGTLLWIVRYAILASFSRDDGVR